MVAKSNSSSLQSRLPVTCHFCICLPFNNMNFLDLQLHIPFCCNVNVLPPQNTAGIWVQFPNRALTPLCLTLILIFITLAMLNCLMGKQFGRTYTCTIPIFLVSIASIIQAFFGRVFGKLRFWLCRNLEFFPWVIKFFYLNYSKNNQFPLKNRLLLQHFDSKLGILTILQPLLCIFPFV